MRITLQNIGRQPIQKVLKKVMHLFFLTLNFHAIKYLKVLNVTQICSPRMQRGHDGSPPVQCDGQHSEHRGGHRAQADELVQGAVELSIMPVPKNVHVICHGLIGIMKQSSYLKCQSKSKLMIFSILSWKKVYYVILICNM